jgi:AcrR family transcriptional regulator
MPVPVHSSDPRVKRTRQLLQEAMIALLAERGFHEITVQDIAGRATVNRATFYAHFTDKYDLMDSCVREGFQRMLAEKLPPASAWSVHHLQTLVMTVFEFMAMVHHECTPTDHELDPLLERAVQEEIAHVLTGWLQQAASQPKGSPPLPETVALVTSWAIFGTAVQWASGERKVAIDEMAHQVLAVVSHGLAVTRVL